MWYLCSALNLNQCAAMQKSIHYVARVVRARMLHMYAQYMHCMQFMALPVASMHLEHTDI